MELCDEVNVWKPLLTIMKRQSILDAVAAQDPALMTIDNIYRL